jgi:hypothetical protein
MSGSVSLSKQQALFAATERLKGIIQELEGLMDQISEMVGGDEDALSSLGEHEFWAKVDLGFYHMTLGKVLQGMGIHQVGR